MTLQRARARAWQCRCRMHLERDEIFLESLMKAFRIVQRRPRSMAIRTLLLRVSCLVVLALGRSKEIDCMVGSRLALEGSRQFLAAPAAAFHKRAVSTTITEDLPERVLDRFNAAGRFLSGFLPVGRTRKKLRRRIKVLSYNVEGGRRVARTLPAAQILVIPGIQPVLGIEELQSPSAPAPILCFECTARCSDGKHANNKGADLE
jgi:hypothetical protein